jgi:hypothetical protein
MRDLVQPPPSLHCDHCNGELRLKLIEPTNSVNCEEALATVWALARASSAAAATLLLFFHSPSQTGGGFCFFNAGEIGRRNGRAKSVRNGPQAEFRHQCFGEQRLSRALMRSSSVTLRAQIKHCLDCCDTQRMSLLGQSRLNWAVRAISGLPPVATGSRM